MNLLSGMNWLRAMAALLVVFYHLNQKLPMDGLSEFSIDIHQLMEHLSIMVSVFFMLSGFFRSLSYWKHWDTPERIPAFLPSCRERFFRIAPAYYVMLVLSLLVTYLLSGIAGINFPAFISWLFFLSWVSSDTIFPVLINGPLWFIPMDMMGWIFTSLTMWWLFHVEKSYRIFYVISIILLTLWLHFAWIYFPWTPGSGIGSVWFPAYNPFLFFLHFLFGIAAAGVVTWLKRRQQKVSIFFDIKFVITTLITIVWLWIIRERGDWALSIPNWPYHFPWFTSMVLMMMVSLPYSLYMGRILDNAFFTFTARLSYSLFLTHALIIVLLSEYIFIGELTLTTWWIFSIATIILSYISAWILYRYIEIPSIRKR